MIQQRVEAWHSGSWSCDRLEKETNQEVHRCSTDLRSMTQGQGTFSMEFARYRRLPRSLEEEVIAERKKVALAVVF